MSADTFAPDAALERTAPMGSRGTTLPAEMGRYHIRGRLGEGGMGVVLRGWDPELGREVAIKLLRAPGDDRHTARLRREARSLARLAHPNVVPVYDVGDHGDSIWVAMQLVAGVDGRTWLARERPSWRRVLGVFRAAGRGLAAVHSAGLVHRDFKPANVIVGDDGRVRVVDFGLARSPGRSGAEGPVDSRRATPLTEEGTAPGTPLYMAPEQLLGKEIDARTDQYAFCMSLYEALYGQPPFPTGTLRMLAEAKRDHRVTPPPAGSSVPPRLYVAICRGLRPDPTARHPDMPALLRELRMVAEDRPRRWPWMLGAVSLVAVGSWVAFRPAPEPPPPPGLSMPVAEAIAAARSHRRAGEAEQALAVLAESPPGEDELARGVWHLEAALAHAAAGEDAQPDLVTGYFAAVGAGDPATAARCAAELSRIDPDPRAHWAEHARAHAMAAGDEALAVPTP